MSINVAQILSIQICVLFSVKFYHINLFSKVSKTFNSVIDDITKAVPGLKLKRSYGKIKFLYSVLTAFRLCHTQSHARNLRLSKISSHWRFTQCKFYFFDFFENQQNFRLFKRSITGSQSDGSTILMLLLYLPVLLK